MKLSFFFNDTATTEIYTLSLHDALPISVLGRTLGAVLELVPEPGSWQDVIAPLDRPLRPEGGLARSEEHTSELQSRLHVVCRLLLEKTNRGQMYHCKHFHPQVAAPSDSQ